MSKHLNGSLKGREKRVAGRAHAKVDHSYQGCRGEVMRGEFNVTDHHHGSLCEAKALSAGVAPASPRFVSAITEVKFH
jgi:hypothetical protein